MFKRQTDKETERKIQTYIQINKDRYTDSQRQMDIQTGGQSDTEETRPKKGPRCDSHSHHDPLKKF